MVISVTRLDGWQMLVNTDDISLVEKQFDQTVIIMRNGQIRQVDESIKTIQARIQLAGETK